MRFKSPLLAGTLIQRYKRFLADVRLASGEVVIAHCTNTGSMMGCKEPGSAVYISRSDNQNRKLLYTWELIRADNTWVGINTLHPNKLVPEAVQAGRIDELCDFDNIRREVKVSAHSRLDLCLEGRNGSCFVEIKNVTLAVHGAAAFPDAVSDRGTRHLKDSCASNAKAIAPPSSSSSSAPTAIAFAPPMRSIRSTAAGSAARSTPESRRCPIARK